MKGIKKALLWFGLLSKRLYKKITFVAILALIPVLVLGYSVASRGDSGMITVALAQSGEDALAGDMMDSLDDSGQLVRYIHCADPAAAETLVCTGKADMAWVFPKNMQQKLEAFMEEPEQENAIVTVLVREDNVSLKLAREKLSGLLYQQVGRLVYIRFVRENVPQLEHLSDEDLMKYFRTREFGTELFDFGETNAAAKAHTTHYLTAPVRGLLAVVVVLCGMATALYYMQDSRRGTFAWMGASRRPLAELGCQMVSLVNVSAVVLAALVLSGLSDAWGRELATLLLYCLCCASFCMLLRRLCGSVRALSTLLPLLVVGMLVICPVFFDLGALRSLQYLFPPTYYINGVYNAKYLGYMLVHTLVTSGLYLLLGPVLRRD